MTFTLKKLLLICTYCCYITYDRTMYSSPVKKDGDGTSSTTSSPTRSRHNAGLSPRQRRLLQAAKRAKAKNNIIGTDDKTTNTLGDHNKIEDSKVSANNNSSFSSTSIPSSPASPTIQNTPQSSTNLSVGGTPINELKSSLSSISPIQHQSSIGNSSSSPVVLSSSRPIHEFNTPPQKTSTDDSMKYSSVGITKSKISTNRSNNRLNRTSSNTASSNIASINNSLQRLNIKPSVRDISTINVTTQRSRSNSHEQRLKINSKWQATANKYNHIIPPPSPSRGSPGSVEEASQQDVEDLKYEIKTQEDGSPTLNVVRSGNVSDRIRKFSNSPSRNDQIPQETSKLIHVRPVGEHKKKTIGESSIQQEYGARQMKRGPLHEKITDSKHEEKVADLQKINQPIQKLRHQIPRNEQHTKPQRNPSDENIRKSQKWHRTVNQQSSQKQMRYPSDENIGSGNELRYYRIVFRGVVSLISSLDDIQQSKTITDETKLCEKAKTKIYVGYGEILGTTSPEIIIPLPKNNDDVSNSEKKQTFERAIRVDSILTGGYGTDLIEP